MAQRIEGNQAVRSGGWRIIAPDLRGHGETERVGVGGYYYFLDYLADLAELLPALTRGRLFLAGHSMGSSLAALFGGVFPQRVHALVLCESLGPPAEQIHPADRIARWVDQARAARQRRPRVYSTALEAASRLRERDPRLPAERAHLLAERATRSVSQDGARSFPHDPLHLSRGPIAFDLDAARQIWSRIACPTLVIDAEKGEWQVPDQAERVASIPGARRIVLPALHHMVHWDAPETLADLIFDFVEGTVGPAKA